MKLLDSNEIRQLRDVCIFEVNGIEVYMNSNPCFLFVKYSQNRNCFHTIS